MNTQGRLAMALGEAMFSMRAIRRYKPDPIPEQDIRDIVQAATQAPSGGNMQPWHFVIVRDQQQRTALAKLYHEAWWAKRSEMGMDSPDKIPATDLVALAAKRLADEFGHAPIVVLVCATLRHPQVASFVIPATQNLLLAARALGIGGTITTLHSSVEDKVHALFSIPDSAQLVYCVPLGYPLGNFGPLNRKPLAEVTSIDSWGITPDW